MRRYFTSTGATIYTWTSDQHSRYGTRAIPSTVSEATYVLDAISDNELVGSGNGELAMVRVVFLASETSSRPSGWGLGAFGITL